MTNQPYPPNPRPSGYTTAGSDDNTVPVNNMGNAYRENEYAENQRSTYVGSAGNEVENQVQVYEDKNLQRANIRHWVTASTYFVLGVLEVIMGLRFLFRLLGASEGNDFIMSLYNLSHVFVAPFNGIFNDQTIGSRSVFELSTLVAMLIYALIAWGLVSLGRVVWAPAYDSQQRVVTTYRR